MPTTLPLDPGDDAEGQLKPIAQFSLPAPQSAPAPQPAATPPVPATPTPAAAPAVAPAAAPAPAPAQIRTMRQPAAQHPGMRTSLNAPSLSLNRRHAEAAAAPTATAAQAPQSARTFSDEELSAAWTQYIEQHAADRLLINTMRVSHPQRTAVENTFEVVVESDIQVELMNEAMPDLLASLRKTLQNSLIRIAVRANSGQSSPITWNEREVLADIIERHPTFKSFIDDLGLSLL